MKNKKLTKEEIIEAIKKSYASLEKTPSRSKFISLTGISEYKVLRHFSSWNEAIKAAGLEPDLSNIKFEDSDLLEDWAKLVRKLRQIPARSQYQKLGKYSSGVFEKHFGPWSLIPEQFRQFAKNKPEWKDVIALLPTEKRKSIVKRPYLPPSSKNFKYSKLGDRTTYGNPIDFRGLRHEPVNEIGVVLLFGIVAKELGYSIEAIRAGYPDCEAKRQIGPNRWQRVLIEFEYESRNFLDHGHSLDSCDVIVCWKHNWSDCPDSIEVLELRSIIDQLAKSE